MRKFLLAMVLISIAACTTNKNERQPATSSELSLGQKAIGVLLRRDMDVRKFNVNQVGTRVNLDHYYPGDNDHKEKMFKDLIDAPKHDFALLLDISERRKSLLANNLINTGVDVDSGINCSQIMTYPHRTANGQCYYHGLENVLARDPEKGKDDKKFATMPRVGDNEQKFGRNISKDIVNEALKNYGVNVGPNPQLISEKLLMRKSGTIRPAPPVNILIAAWLQAQNHDWFSHGKNQDLKKSPIEIAGHSGASATVHGDREFAQAQDFRQKMLIPKTAVETPEQKARPQDENTGYNYTSRNHLTHWWDASQIYGNNQATINKVRTNPVTGKPYDENSATWGFIAVDMQKRQLYYEKDQNGRPTTPITGFHDNWWVGLELIHSLFAMEHNYVAKELRQKNPNMDAERIFQTARMIVSALIAKIHTIEWTPATLDNKALHAGMFANWYGLKGAAGIEFKSQFLRQAMGILSSSLQHAVSGLTGPNTLHLYNVPFTLTEEFVAVYRMHPLLPEKIDVWANLNAKGQKKATIPVEDTVFRKAKGLLDSHSTLDLMYGFGTGHPGLVVLNNYPTFMKNFVAERNFKNERGESSDLQLDMGAMDIVRDRERGVPRYNQFRVALGLPPISSFNELENSETLREVYGKTGDSDNVDQLDLLVGNLAEKRYNAYAFGNTQFFIFALMASRRLMGDPFLSDYYTPEFYTKWGFDHVEKESMATVIVRHYKELEPALRGIKNAFRPWNPVFNDVKTQMAKIIEKEAAETPQVEETF